MKFARDAFVPHNLSLHRSIGKGANNHVYKAIQTDDATGEKKRVAFRAPRRRSDTQYKMNATWEGRCTMRASELGVHPQVHDMWRARHARGEWPSGLYVISDMYPHDLETVIFDRELRERYLSKRETVDEVGRRIAAQIERLANDKMLLFDLKLSNIVVSFNGEEDDEEDDSGDDEDDSEDEDGSEEDGSSEEEGEDEETEETGNEKEEGKEKTKETERGPVDVDDVDVRIIDFGVDFCEWDTAVCEGESSETFDVCPPKCAIVRMVRDCAQKTNPEMDVATVDALVSHVLFAAMLVITSATFTYMIHDARREHRMGRDERAAVHPLAGITRAFLDTMRGDTLRILKCVLRGDEIKGVLRHYHHRRNAGTRRTLKLAVGEETFT